MERICLCALRTKSMHKPAYSSIIPAYSKHNTSMQQHNTSIIQAYSSIIQACSSISIYIIIQQIPHLPNQTLYGFSKYAGWRDSHSGSGDCFNTGCMNHSRQPSKQLDMGQHPTQYIVRMRRPDKVQHGGLSGGYIPLTG